MEEDSPFTHATLYYRRDLRCKASREYYMEILNGFRVPTTTEKTTSSPDANTVMIDDEEVFDMIG